MKNENAILRSKQVAQECAMKAGYYRKEFNIAGWKNLLAALGFGFLGLIMLFVFLPVGMIILAFAGLAAYDSYKSFEMALEAYGEYHGLRDEILDAKHHHEMETSNDYDPGNR